VEWSSGGKGGGKEGGVLMQAALSMHVQSGRVNVYFLHLTVPRVTAL